MKTSNSLGKCERLKSRKLISQLFREGKSFNVSPLRVLWITSPDAAVTLQAGFSVSSRIFKKSVDRNRIKRLLRESYRTQKQQLAEQAEQKAVKIILFFIYTGREIPEYALIYQKTREALGTVTRKLTSGQ